MTWLVALLLLATSSFAAKPYDAAIDAAMARFRGAKDWYPKCEELRGLEKLMKSDQADDELAAKLTAIAQDVGHHDPDNQVRYCAGDLAQGVESWHKWDSPDAKAAKRREQRVRDRENLAFNAVPVVMILVLLGGGMIIVASQIGAAYLVVHRDRLLEEGVHSTIALFLKHPAFFFIPALDTALFSALASLSYWSVLRAPSLPATASVSQIHARALAVVYQPTSLLAVLAAFCVSMFAGAAYAAAQVRASRGEDASLATGLGDALGSARAILALSASAGAALIGFDWLMRRVQGFFSLREELFAQFASAAAESTALLGLNIAFCAAVFEGKGPAEALGRAGEVLRPEWRSGMRAVTATALLRNDVFVTPLVCCALCTYPMWMLFLFVGDHTYWLLNGGLEFIAMACAGVGAAFASFILSMVWLLDASFAAAIYSHATGRRPLPLSVARAMGERSLDPA